MTALPPTAEQWLDSLIEESNGKMTIAAMILGFNSHASVSHRLRRMGLKWRSCRDFEYRGQTGPMRQHCERYGLSANAVSCYRHRSGLSGPEVLDRYLAGKVERYRFGMGK